MSTNKRPFRRWTQEEDELLRQAVARDSSKAHHPHDGTTLHWSRIAASVPNRPAVRCRERWCNILDPEVNNRGPWTAEEDALIRESYHHKGPQWVEIAKILNATLDVHRTGDIVKRHAKAIMPEFRNEKKRKNGPSNNRTQAKKKNPTSEKNANNAAATRKSNRSPSSDDDNNLATSWRKQQQLRRTGKWKPSGGWKPPRWAIVPQGSSAPPAAAPTAARIAPETTLPATAFAAERAAPGATNRVPPPPLPPMVRDLIDKHMPAVAEKPQPLFVKSQIMTDNKDGGDDSLAAAAPTMVRGDDDASGTTGIDESVCFSTTGKTLHSVSVSSVDDDDNGSTHGVPPASSATTASELGCPDAVSELPRYCSTRKHDGRDTSKQGATKSAPRKNDPYVTPTDDLLVSAHAAMSDLLPDGD